MSNDAINWAREQIGIGSPAKFVLWVIADRFNEEQHEAWPSHDSIARDTNLSLRTIGRAVRELEAAGMVAVDRSPDADGRKMQHRYYLPTFDPESVPPDSLSGPSGKTTTGLSVGLPPDSLSGPSGKTTTGLSVGLPPDSLSRPPDSLSGGLLYKPLEPSFEPLPLPHFAKSGDPVISKRGALWAEGSRAG